MKPVDKPRCQLCHNPVKHWIGAKHSPFGVCGVHLRWAKRRLTRDMLLHWNYYAIRGQLGFVFPYGTGWYAGVVERGRDGGRG